MIDAGADVNKADETALNVAVYTGQEDIVHLLINAGADLYKAHNNCYTPLYVVVPLLILFG